jgi:hypothetical protein
LKIKRPAAGFSTATGLAQTMRLFFPILSSR